MHSFTPPVLQSCSHFTIIFFSEQINTVFIRWHPVVTASRYSRKGTISYAEPQDAEALISYRLTKSDRGDGGSTVYIGGKYGEDGTTGIRVARVRRGEGPAQAREAALMTHLYLPPETVVPILPTDQIP